MINKRRIQSPSEKTMLSEKVFDLTIKCNLKHDRGNRICGTGCIDK